MSHIQPSLNVEAQTAHVEADELASLRARLQTLELAMGILQEGFWDWELASGRVWRSPGFYRMLGYDPDKVPTTPEGFLRLIHPEDREWVARQFADFLQDGQGGCVAEFRCKRADGRYLWVEDEAFWVAKTEEGRPLRLIGSLKDVHQRKLAELALRHKSLQLESLNLQLENVVRRRTRELEQANALLRSQLTEITRLSTHDSLTEIYNRRKFESVFADELEKSGQGLRPLCLLIFDIDHFKRINDQYGHPVGDQVLIRLTRWVAERLRQTDTFARWGGEEFILLLPRTRREEAFGLAERLREGLAVEVFTQTIRLTVSMGVAQLRPGETGASLIGRADQYLYEAKRSRNCSISHP